MDAFGWLGKSFSWIHLWQQAGLGGAACRNLSSANPGWFWFCLWCSMLKIELSQPNF
jgi:hypothetical protein